MMKTEYIFRCPHCQHHSCMALRSGPPGDHPVDSTRYHCKQCKQKWEFRQCFILAKVIRAEHQRSCGCTAVTEHYYHPDSLHLISLHIGRTKFCNDHNTEQQQRRILSEIIPVEQWPR